MDYLSLARKMTCSRCVCRFGIRTRTATCTPDGCSVLCAVPMTSSVYHRGIPVCSGIYHTALPQLRLLHHPEHLEKKEEKKRTNQQSAITWLSETFTVIFRVGIVEEDDIVETFFVLLLQIGAGHLVDVDASVHDRHLRVYARNDDGRRCVAGEIRSNRLFGRTWTRILFFFVIIIFFFFFLNFNFNFNNVFSGSGELLSPTWPSNN